MYKLQCGMETPHTNEPFDFCAHAYPTLGDPGSCPGKDIKSSSSPLIHLPQFLLVHRLSAYLNHRRSRHRVSQYPRMAMQPQQQPNNDGATPLSYDSGSLADATCHYGRVLHAWA